MRVILMLLACAVLFAGCATTDNGNAGTNNSTSGGGTCAPKVIKTEDHTFSDTPAQPAAPTALKIDPGCSNISLNVTFDNVQGAPAGVAQGVSVTVGKAVCALPDGPNTGPVKCGPKPGAATGVKQIDYAGSGTVTAHVIVTES